MKVLTLASSAFFLCLSKSTTLVAGKLIVPQDFRNYEALETRSSLRKEVISSEDRNLQFQGLNLFTLVSNSVVLAATISGVIVSDIAAVTSAVVQSVVTGGISVQNLVSIVSAQVATTLVTISAEVVSYVTENFNGILNTFIGSLLQAVDPLDLALSEDPKVFMEVESCDYTYSISSAELHGTGNINFDTLSIDDFSYENNVLQFSAVGEISAETLEVRYQGEVSSVDDCLGQTAIFTYFTFYSDISCSVDGFVEGDVTNGNNLTITTADIATFTVENYMTYTSSLSNLPTGFSSDVSVKLTEALDSYIGEFEDELTAALDDTSTFLEEVGAPLPQSIELPIDIPF